MGYQGRATECQIQAREILKTRDRIIDIYCEQTGKDYETIKQAIDRDNWMVAEEALEFGLLDKIVKSRMELNELLKILSWKKKNVKESCSKAWEKYYKYFHEKQNDFQIL